MDWLREMGGRARQLAGAAREELSNAVLGPEAPPPVREGGLTPEQISELIGQTTAGNQASEPTLELGEAKRLDEGAETQWTCPGGPEGLCMGEAERIDEGGLTLELGEAERLPD